MITSSQLLRRSERCTALPRHCWLSAAAAAVSLTCFEYSSSAGSSTPVMLVTMNTSAAAPAGQQRQQQCNSHPATPAAAQAAKLCTI
jgi:hypothetical protein